MIPVIKGWCTETSIDVASMALQVFGGMGYIEETGIAQQYRDVRIMAIYEGTTSIQALDLVGRKLIRDSGAVAAGVIAAMRKTARELDGNDADCVAIRTTLTEGIDVLAEASEWIRNIAQDDLRKAFACSVPYLRLWGVVAGGWQMARAAHIARQKIAEPAGDVDFYKAKLTTARFYADHVLSQAPWLRHQITSGAAGVMALSEDQYLLDRKSTVMA